METGLTTLADVMSKAGGWGVAAVFVWLYMKERVYAQGLNSKILELAIKNTEVGSAQTQAIIGLKELITRVFDKE